MPAYQDYVLQRGADQGGAPKKYRTRTFLAGNIDELRLKEHDQLGDSGGDDEGLDDRSVCSIQLGIPGKGTSCVLSPTGGEEDEEVEIKLSGPHLESKMPHL